MTYHQSVILTCNNARSTVQRKLRISATISLAYELHPQLCPFVRDISSKSFLISLSFFLSIFLSFMIVAQKFATAAEDHLQHIVSDHDLGT